MAASSKGGNVLKSSSFYIVAAGFCLSLVTTASAVANDGKEWLEVASEDGKLVQLFVRFQEDSCSNVEWRVTNRSEGVKAIFLSDTSYECKGGRSISVESPFAEYEDSRANLSPGYAWNVMKDCVCGGNGGLKSVTTSFQARTGGYSKMGSDLPSTRISDD